MPERIATYPAEAFLALGENHYNVDAAEKHLHEILDHLAETRKHFPQATGLDLYDPRPSDIVVTTFPKAGTTLTQQLVYQTAVATGGAPAQDPDGSNFSDICEVAPWLDYIPQLDFPFLESSPRVFKTHAGVEKFSITKQKHIVVLRDPLKFPSSWLNFTVDNYPSDIVTSAGKDVRQLWFDHTVACDLLGLGPSTLGDSGALGPNEGDMAGGIYTKSMQQRLGPWFIHTLGWVHAVGHPNVLVMFYEDVVADMATATRVVAAFMGRRLSREGLQQVVHRCSREYMASGDRFKSYMDSKLFGTDMNSSKVRHEHGNNFRDMQVKEEHLKELRRQMMHAFGVPSYKELKDLVTSKQSQVRSKNYSWSHCNRIE